MRLDRSHTIKVCADRLRRRAHMSHPACIQPEGPITKRAHGLQRMADEHNGAGPANQLLHTPHALRSKGLIAYREDFVKEQDVRIKVHRNGEGQPGEHASRVSLQWTMYGRL